MAKYSIDSSTLTDIADAIRDKTGSTDSILVSALAETIESISGSEFNTSTCTLMEESDVLTFDIDEDNAPKLCIVVATTPTDLIGNVSYNALASIESCTTFVATGYNKALKGISGTMSFAKTNEQVTVTNPSGTYKYGVGVEYTLIYW